MKKDKSWMTEDEPICAILPSHCFRVTVFGAIGTTLKQGCMFMLADSTNQVDFRRFLRDLKY